MPVHLETTCKNVFFVDFDALFLAACAPLFEHGFQFLLGVLFLVAHRGGAFEILILNGALFLAILISSISPSRSLTSGGRVIVPMRAREPASSIRSMALSGR